MMVRGTVDQVSNLSWQSPPASPARRTTTGVRVRWGICAVLCLGVVGIAAQYYFRRPTGHFGEHYDLLLAHIIGGSIALLIGPWQFSQRLRRRNLSLHRWMGSVYLLAVALGSLAGFGLAFFSMGGLPTHLGFGFLAVAWAITGWLAYRTAVNRQIEQHRQWMIRNFSLSLAAVTLRHYLPLALFVMHWPFLPAYTAISWLCWVPNLVVAEWIIRRRWAVAAA